MNTNVNAITESEYKTFLSEVRKLVELDPAEGTVEAERLKLVSLAVQSYEKNNFPFSLPTAISAIKFRMEEVGLNQNDVASYFGGKNRVSEILSGARPLTLPMIKALNRFLGIPLEVLMHDEEARVVSFEPKTLIFAEPLIKEIVKKGWLSTKEVDISNVAHTINNFLKPIGGSATAALFRQSPQANVRGINNASAFLWISKVLIEAQKIEAFDFDQERIDIGFLRQVAKLSYFENGPLLAREELAKNGIKLVIVPHLNSTFLDGGTVSDSKGSPVIGLSLRYDRLDSFWHTLMHELIHVQKHLKIVKGPFLDDGDISEISDPIEKEADQLAREVFVPKSIWRSSDVLHFRTEKTINELAKHLHISPAIIAGRVRFETKNYSIFSDLLGLGQVRKLFGSN
jgi:HTH-type transcriptional regulator / antitoxin HigA